MGPTIGFKKIQKILTQQGSIKNGPEPKNAKTPKKAENSRLTFVQNDRMEMVEWTF